MVSLHEVSDLTEKTIKISFEEKKWLPSLLTLTDMLIILHCAHTRYHRVQLRGSIQQSKVYHGGCMMHSAGLKQQFQILFFFLPKIK